jgi:hypothetical protein
MSLVALCGPRSAAANPDQVPLVAVTNVANPTGSVSVGDLRRMLMGETRKWPHGPRVTVAMREPGEPQRGAVLRLVCHMTEQDFYRRRLLSTFQGAQTDYIKQLDTDASVLRYVVNVPGAVGFVRADSMDGSVKALRVTGAATAPLPDGFVLQGLP